MARALGLASYKEARTKTFFLEQLSRSALRTTATGEPNTAFYLQFPALSEFLEQPNTFQAVNHYFSTDGDFAAEPIFQLTAMALNTTIDLESLTKPGNYIARYEPITSPAANVINLLMREDRACSMYEEESNGDFRELSLSDGHIWGVTQYGAESAGKRAAAGPRRPALNRHRGAGRRATLARRPLAHGGEPSDSSTPGSSPQVSPPRATAGQAPSTASLDFQPEAVYWFNQNAQVFTLRQHSQCLAGRVVRVNPDGIQCEWLYEPGVLVL